VTDDPPARLTIWVVGRVQGVGFRWWVREQATASGLAGSASNLADGSVEIILEGARAGCAALLDRLRDGSPPGRVGSTTHRWGSATGMQTFALG